MADVFKSISDAENYYGYVSAANVFIVLASCVVGNVRLLTGDTFHIRSGTFTCMLHMYIWMYVCENDKKDFTFCGRQLIASLGHQWLFKSFGRIIYCWNVNKLLSFFLCLFVTRNKYLQLQSEYFLMNNDKNVFLIRFNKKKLYVNVCSDIRRKRMRME